MSVMLSKNCPWYPSKPECTVCGDQLCGPPFVQWMGTEEMIICPRCCRGLLTGLVADMIQVVAIADIQARGYHGCTLVRASQKDVNTKEKAGGPCGWCDLPWETRTSPLVASRC